MYEKFNGVWYGGFYDELREIIRHDYNDESNLCHNCGDVETEDLCEECNQPFCIECKLGHICPPEDIE